MMIYFTQNIAQRNSKHEIFVFVSFDVKRLSIKPKRSCFFSPKSKCNIVDVVPAIVPDMFHKRSCRSSFANTNFHFISLNDLSFDPKLPPLVLT